MPNDPSFELIEDAAFTGSTSWRLKGNHIHFRGRNGDGEPLPPRRPIPARKEQVASFATALDFLQVWDWKPNYDPLECGYAVCDGMSWSFTALIHGRRIKSGGSNAYPSFADPSKASIDPERYAFLVFALRSSFCLDLRDDFAPRS